MVSNYDDFEAYNPNLVTVRGGLEYRRSRGDGLMFSARAGASLQLNTSGDPGDDAETYFDYGARAGYEGAKALATVALTGRYLITAPEHDFICTVGDPECNPKGFNERTHHHVTGVLELRTMSSVPVSLSGFPSTRTSEHRRRGAGGGGVDRAVSGKR